MFWLFTAKAIACAGREKAEAAEAAEAAEGEKESNHEWLGSPQFGNFGLGLSAKGAGFRGADDLLVVENG